MTPKASVRTKTKAAPKKASSKRASSASKDVFDAEYYARFYEERGTQVHSANEVGRLCTAVVSFLEWWQVPLGTVLDVGAGVGLWRTWFAENRPKVRYRSTEYSAHACQAYGHEQRDITSWREETTFDLVICQGVLPYLDDDGARRAIANLAAMTESFLYLEAITKRDIRAVCDVSRTDVKVYGRTGDWYRKELRKHFVEVGCGLFCKKSAGVLFYELEASAFAGHSRTTSLR